MKILHVTECHSGGVSRAILSRINSTPEYEHHLLWAGAEPPKADSAFVSTTEFPQGFFRRLNTFRNLSKSLNPQIIHAHSSWAGVYTRLRKNNIPLVYEPHCFKFEDPNLNKIQMVMFFLAEKFLAKNTSAFGVLSNHEVKLVQELNHNAKIITINNVPSFSAQKISAEKDGFKKVLMVGRVCKQKDPIFFLKVLEEISNLGFHLTPIWVGDGERQLLERLQSSGVLVTGWQSPESLTELFKGSIYVHTASYEGFPLSLLEASACGVPIVARRLSSLEGYPILQAETPKGVAQLVKNVLQSNQTSMAAVQLGNELSRLHNSKTLKASLDALYVKAIKTKNLILE